MELLPTRLHEGNHLPNVIKDNSEQANVSKEHRPLRIFSVPTSFFLFCKPVSHHALVIGDPASPGGVLKSELQRIDDSSVTHNTFPLSGKALKNLHQLPIIGYTIRTNAEIEDHAASLITTYETYNVFKRNCQRYVQDLVARIKEDSDQNEVSPGARYRVAEEYLRFADTFDYSRPKPGWICLSADKILIDVAVTEVEGVWQGQVEGTDERGLFLRDCVRAIHRGI